MANPFPFVASTVLTAAQLNGIGEAWTTFTPVWTSSGVAPSIGNGTMTGKFCRVNKLIVGTIAIVPGSTTTFGTGSFLLNFPVTPTAPLYPFAVFLSEGLYYDTSTANGYKLSATYNGTSTTNFRLQIYANASQLYALLGATTPVTIATSDEILINFCYEAA